MKQLSKRSFELVWLMAKTDFKLRYQGSILGFLWALLKPIFLFGILSLVFSNLFVQIQHYSFQLLTGIFFWSFFAEGTMLGLISLQNKAHLLTKIAFPRWVVVVAATLQILFTFLIHLLILLIAMVIVGLPLTIWQMLMVLAYVLLLYVLILGFSLFAAPFFLRFRDFNQIWEVLLMGGFYAAPIIYPLNILPLWLQPWMYLNPMTFLIGHVREVLFSGALTQLQQHVLYLGMVVFVLFFGICFFRKFERQVVELL